jgi:hypothetical protein
MPYTFAGLWAGDAFVDTNSGVPLRATQFSVLLQDGVTLATLYTDRTKQSAAPNPATTDNNGNGAFYADPGIYLITCLNNTITVEVSADANEPTLHGGLAQILRGTGTPVSTVSAPVGSIYLREDGGPGSTLYVKESGSGATGWAAK